MQQNPTKCNEYSCPPARARQRRSSGFLSAWICAQVAASWAYRLELPSLSRHANASRRNVPGIRVGIHGILHRKSGLWGRCGNPLGSGGRSIARGCSGAWIVATGELKVVEGVAEEYVEAALRLGYSAFAKKFRHGFRDGDDLVRLLRDSVDRRSCFSATVDGKLCGLLTFQTADQEFYHLNLVSAFTRFLPWRAVRMLFNLILLVDDGVGPDEFVVDSLAVDPSYRGMGVGTTLMRRAEEKARSMGKRRMSLWVIGENEGAIRLYERLGYETTKTLQGFLVRLAAESAEVRRMEMQVVGARSDPGDSRRQRELS